MYKIKKSSSFRFLSFRNQVVEKKGRREKVATNISIHIFTRVIEGSHPLSILSSSFSRVLRKGFCPWANNKVTVILESATRAKQWEQMEERFFVGQSQCLRKRFLSMPVPHMHEGIIARPVDGKSVTPHATANRNAPYSFLPSSSRCDTYSRRIRTVDSSRERIGFNNHRFHLTTTGRYKRSRIKDFY